MGRRVGQRYPRDLAAVPAAGVLTSAAARYRAERLSAPAGDLHARALPEPMVPTLWRLEPTAPALVLGSTQHDDVVDHDAADRAGVEVARRRSGGGAVLLIPGEVVWFDVLLPAGAPGWSDDVHRPMEWLGAHLAASIAEVAPGIEPVIHRGALRPTRWSPTVCWDGLGAGELTVDGEKLVGISQRRTRAGARLQCSWFRRDPTDRLIALLSAAHRPPRSALAAVAVIADLDPDRTLGTLRRRLDEELGAAS